MMIMLILGPMSPLAVWSRHPWMQVHAKHFISPVTVFSTRDWQPARFPNPDLWIYWPSTRGTGGNHGFDINEYVND